MAAPRFSIVVSTYNRARLVSRCVDSCLAQSLGDFELIVVDDGSVDDTVRALRAYDDPRMRVIAHQRNRGISPARRTGVDGARGEWIVIVDSDWELMPHALARLREIVAGLPAGVRVVRSRLLWDDGSVTPSFVPPEPLGYEGRIRWAEAEGGNDAAHCMHRSVFDATPYPADRRGAMETLYELDLARRETALYVEDVLGKEHTDAPNSWLRSISSSELIPRLYAEAPDMLWMAETTLERHGQMLRRHGPGQHLTVLRVAAVQAFLLGRRRKGAAYALRALGGRRLDPLAWATLALGLLGRGAVARGTLAFRLLSFLRGSGPRRHPRRGEPSRRPGALAAGGGEGSPPGGR